MDIVARLALAEKELSDIRDAVAAGAFAGVDRSRLELVGRMFKSPSGYVGNDDLAWWTCARVEYVSPSGEVTRTEFEVSTDGIPRVYRVTSYRFDSEEWAEIDSVEFERLVFIVALSITRYAIDAGRDRSLGVGAPVARRAHKLGMLREDDHR